MATVSAPSVVAELAQWDELRREARRLEGDLDVRLSAYAKLGSSPGRGSLSSPLPDLIFFRPPLI